MLNILLITLATFLVGNFAGYVVHRTLHCRWSGRAYKDHLHHHNRIYPPSDYLSDEYREPPVDAEQGKYYIAAFILLCTPFLLWHWAYFLVAVVEAILVLKANAWVHDILHIRGHAFERFKFFNWLRAVHFQHHVNVHTNFGIFVFYPDKLLCTYAGKRELPVNETIPSV